MFGVGVDGWFTLLVLGIMFVALVRELLGTDIVICAALITLWARGIITTDEATSGFNNPQVLTIGMLFIVSAAMRETGALTLATSFMFGRNLDRKRVLARLIVPTAAMSSILNNTPIVAMLTPLTRDWSLRHGQSPSRFLIPLSYAAILGGTCTLIGTSTNLVVSGLLEEWGYEPFGMFELSVVGVPATVLGIVFLLTAGRGLLPDRSSPEQSVSENRREYAVTLEVQEDCPHIGKSVERAGLRGLRGLFLAEIERAGRMIAPVRPHDMVREGDRLTFVGIADTVVDLQKTQGLVPVAEDGSAASARSDLGRRLFEVVVSNNSPLIGRNLRDARFRRRYDAAVIAVHRGGTRLHRKLGDVVLRAGDTLMVEAAEGFRSAWANQGDFYLVAQVEESERPNYKMAPLALGIALTMVALMGTRTMGTLMASSIAAMLLVLTGCIRVSAARRSLDLTVLITIAASFGISAAVANSGLADIVATSIVAIFSDFRPWIMLAVLYVLSTICTEIMTNAAAAALILPIAITTAESLERDPRPYAVVVAIAASMSFITPLGYQTNLMVYGPGGYRFSDFVKIGVPMALLCFMVAMLTIPLFWGV